MVKQLVEGPGADGRFGRELTALRVAASAQPAVAPRVLGVDLEQRVLVLEYLESSGASGASGRGGGDEWVVEWAEGLARLHASGSSVVSGAFEAGGDLPVWRGPGDGDARAFLAVAEALGVSVGPGVRSELDGLVGRLEVPGRALLHGDPCPDNFLATAGGGRFVDFEQAAWGPGLVELAYLRIGFPTCWCALSPERPRVAAAEAAYRATWRDVTGTEVAGDLADACAGWLLRGDGLVERDLRGTADHLARLLAEDWTWGVATARQRLLHRLLVVGELAGADRPLTETGRLATEMAGRVRARWPWLRPLPGRWRWWQGLDGG